MDLLFKKMDLIFIIFIVIWLMNINGYSQVNTEAMRKETVDNGFATTISAHQQLSKGNSEYSIVKGSGRLDYLHEKYHTFIIANIKQGKKQEEKFGKLRYLFTMRLF